MKRFIGCGVPLLRARRRELVDLKLRTRNGQPVSLGRDWDWLASLGWKRPPDLLDSVGRLWVWWSHDLYFCSQCGDKGSAKPRAMIQNPMDASNLPNWIRSVLTDKPRDWDGTFDNS